ncbi:MAG: MBL fold metallo-hydrolase [Lachnospiraceae bacterium]|nr:MBL fold metallo-hydrolase [Lachnospiraceae bacterium]MDD7627561.1 MBL fold metallo-hydrolase [Lachnospiraceae bacterium]MDY4120232.1 MBL fold metallo-hydrolase [Lachnospiraceae bacterium]
MQITYVYHSGFLVETTECYYLFDYYKGALPPLKPDKPILVFASHSHGDHYNKDIFSLLKNMGIKHITAILAKDISPKKYPADVEIQRVTFHETYELPCHTTLDTLQSTDVGVAFLVRCPEVIIYHAGDLNDWVWKGEPEQYNKQMTGNYRHEIDLLCKLLKGNTLDVAFLPLDPRQENDYAKGMLYFLKKVNVRQVYPMHYWEKPEIIGRFLQEYPEYARKIVQSER